MSRALSSSLALLAVAILAASVQAWPMFLGSVPNGNNVQFSTVDIGHGEGNMLRNKFGMAFNVFRNWTKELCEADSDGDGQTNGQELGDPCCVWTPENDGALQWTSGISNPGNKTSVTDASLWKSLNCSAVRKNTTLAVITPTTTPSPTTTSSGAALATTGLATLLGAALVALS
ncbi:hypothetical protein Gpo141_00011476 [Globisporangium polare]